MADYISVGLRERLLSVDRQRCCYCLTTTAITGVEMTIDHIQPQAKGGATCFENLCLACSACNTFKSDTTKALDPVSQKVVPLFNPRTQQWSDHFAWSSDKTQIDGITPTGRATVVVLKMNRPIIVFARQRWVQVGWHPPVD
ncbi:MAG: HNH endonuclease [Cyanobacteria bacterium P01_F01_bin.150]